MAKRKDINIVVRARDLASKKLRGIGRSMSFFSRSLSRLAGPLKMLGLIGGLGGGVLGGVGLAKIFQIDTSFEHAMARVGALTGAVGDEFAVLTKKAREMGRDTVFNANQAAEAMQFFALAGFKTNQILDAMLPTLNLAAAGQLEIAQAADIAAKIMAGMNLEASSLGETADILTRGFTTANTTLEQLGQAMSFAGPAALQANIGLKDTVAVLQELSDRGIQAERAGTSFRQIIVKLSNQTPAAAAELKRLGIQVKDVQGQFLPLANIVDQFKASLAGVGRAEALGSLFKIFEARAGTGFAALLGGGGAAIRENIETLGDASITAARVAKRQLDTVRGSLILLRSALSEAAIAFNSEFRAMQRATIDRVTEIVKVIIDGMPEIVGVIKAVGGMMRDIWDRTLGSLVESFTDRFSGGKFKKILERIQILFENWQDTLTLVSLNLSAVFEGLKASMLGSLSSVAEAMTSTKGGKLMFGGLQEQIDAQKKLADAEAERFKVLAARQERKLNNKQSVSNQKALLALAGKLSDEEVFRREQILANTNSDMASVKEAEAKLAAISAEVDARKAANHQAMVAKEAEKKNLKLLKEQAKAAAGAREMAAPLLAASAFFRGAGEQQRFSRFNQMRPAEETAKNTAITNEKLEVIIGLSGNGSDSGILNIPAGGI